MSQRTQNYFPNSNVINLLYTTQIISNKKTQAAGKNHVERQYFLKLLPGTYLSTWFSFWKSEKNLVLFSLLLFSNQFCLTWINYHHGTFFAQIVYRSHVTWLNTCRYQEIFNIPCSWHIKYPKLLVTFSFLEKHQRWIILQKKF